jgi:hypothetical protein
MVPAAVGRAVARGAAWWPWRGARQAERTPDRFVSFLFFSFLSVLVTHMNHGLHTVPPAGPQAGPPTGAGTMVLTVLTVPGRN